MMLSRRQQGKNKHALTQTPLDLIQYWVWGKRTLIPEVLH